VLAGTTGDASRLERTVIGAPVNLAAKLEKHTKREGARALTTADALERARSQGYELAHPPAVRSRRHVEGVAEPLDIIVLG
jgi:adenylate cyclase